MHEHTTTTEQVHQRILDGGMLQQYVETRLFGKNVTPNSITSIELHNGKLPSMLREHIIERYDEDFDIVEQDNRREPIYHRKGTLFIPQYSGLRRGARYESMILAYNNIASQEKKFSILQLDDSTRKTRIAYETYAYDFIKGLFLPNDSIVKEIDAVIVGPTRAVAEQTMRVADISTEYLDAQIVVADGKTALNIGYIYGDQARHIMFKLLREYGALAEHTRAHRKLSILMFGRVGGLGTHMKRHDLVFPTGNIGDDDLRVDRPYVYPMYNVLAQDDRGSGHRGYNLSVESVINETYGMLRHARQHGCMSIDMETRETVEAINAVRRNESRWLDIDFGFVGHVSDRPLVKGDTLAIELDSDEGERHAVERILEYLRHTK